MEELFNNKNNIKYITGDFTYSPGLGNLMFQFAALRVLAERENAYLLLPDDCKLRRAFKLDNKVLFIEAKQLQNFIVKNTEISKNFEDCCKYIPSFGNKINWKNNLHIISIINGYFQSHRYFHPTYTQLISNNFNFLPGIVERANLILKNILFENEKKIRSNSTFLIGIHARHGIDLTMHQRNQRYGHTVATLEYYKKAMEYFIKNKIKNQNNSIIFLVISDNMTWAKRNIKIKKSESTNRISIIYHSSGYREVDMAILTQCNHLIISTGTYSWWSGYLLQNKKISSKIIYFGDWPKKGSVLDKIVDKRDYFPPSWISIK
ncbi:hypothetical protein ACQ4LE_004096 [Meloidogyne hapla]